jgi:PAS domain S-box-containing protein
VINRVAQEMLGYQKAEVLGKDLTSFLPLPAEFIAAVQAGERSSGREMIWAGRNGQQFDVSVSASPIMDERGNTLVGIVYVGHDITERRRVQNELEFRNLILSTQQETSLDAILVVNEVATIISYNQRFLELMRIPPDIAAAKDDTPVLQLVTSQTADPAGFMARVKYLYAHKEQKSHEEILMKDGRVLDRYSAPMFASNGRYYGRVWYLSDITERKQAEERLKTYSAELQESNEELKRFAYIVSHDLRAPLVNIKGFAGEFAFVARDIRSLVGNHLDRFSDEERQKLTVLLEKDVPEAVEFIGSSVNRMDNLISAILKLSRAGRRQLNPEPIDMQEFLQEIVRSLSHQIEARKISVTIGDLPPAVADRTALEQIFGNLLDNAVKYIDPGRAGSIAVTAERGDQETVFHVRDNGRGMALEDIPKAFEMFRRVGKQDVPGEGIGLAYVKTLVRSLGGRIWCESEFGKGTTFSFTISAGDEAVL